MIRSWETCYLNLLDHILTHGEDRADRTGTGTRAVFGEKLVIDLGDGFPAVTTKRLMWKAVATELQWFIEGSGDERRLAEILHGTRDFKNKTIWTDNANADYWKPKAQYPGDLGRVYGVQWRHWRHANVLAAGLMTPHDQGGILASNATALINEVDQLKQVIDTLKTNPTDRRIVLTAWNPAELGMMALPPCHMFAQFYLSTEDNELSCQMYQRSVDSFLGLPFNIASYALLTHQIAHVLGTGVGKLHMVLGDTHIYKDHFDAVKEQLSRSCSAPPTLKFNRRVENIEDITFSDFELVGYEPQAAIPAIMSV